MTEKKTGGLIVWDALDGAGKTTQIDLAAAALMVQGIDVHKTRSHGGTPKGEELREVSLNKTPRIARTDYYISLAIHSELQEDIQARVADGQLVLMDRGPMAIWGYQVFGGGLDAEFATEGIDADLARFNPLLMICYTASIRTLRQRMTARSGPKADYFESMGDDYFEKVAAGYDFAAQRYNVPVIDAEQDIDTVHVETMALIYEALKLSH
jgi:dTMP kinase